MTTAGGNRGSKNPGTPIDATSAALASLKTLREVPSFVSGGHVKRLETNSQNRRRRFTRRSGGLPAMIAELMAPMEIPATHCGA
jgi:hypothetical protein